jgi:Pin2-interacting protein X1
MTLAPTSAGPAAPAALPLVGKKMLNKLGGMANESAAAGVSEFARRQMEKMGWSAGKGLGKQEQGRVSHVKVKKREELAGVGTEKVGVEEQKNQWWYNVYDKLADKIQVAADSDDDASKKRKKGKKSKKDRKRKRSDDEQESSGGGRFRVPTDEELFAATGGKLFGRRAYGSCQGKLKRDALHVAGKLAAKATAEADGTSVESADTSEDSAVSKKDKKKKSKKDKKKQKRAKTSDSDA